jgi:hypothetical protein
MNVQNKILYALSSLVFLTSCKSVKSIGAKDNSTSGTAKVRKPVNGDPKFLNGITINPGAAKGDKHTASTLKTTSKQEVSKVEPDQQLVAGLDIEKAEWLQIKYSLVLDATIEKLTNINLLKTIDYWWGTKYCLGGNTENCIDCSSFTQTVLRDVFKVSLPRTAQQQFDNSERIEMSDLKEGDLVFFHTSGREISHVGVYLLNNKFVHAATSGGVMVSDLNDNYWRPRYKGAGRVVISN